MDTDFFFYLFINFCVVLISYSIACVFLRVPYSPVVNDSTKK